MMHFEKHFCIIAVASWWHFETPAGTVIRWRQGLVYDFPSFFRQLLGDGRLEFFDAFKGSSLKLVLARMAVMNRSISRSIVRCYAENMCGFGISTNSHAKRRVINSC
jgi:hypothetical protein